MCYFVLGIEDLPQLAHVEFTDLHEGKVFFKKQCRKYNIARQIVMNGLVHMKAKCGPDQLLKIRGWVRREPRAAEMVNDKNGAVLICGVDNRELNLITDEDVPSITEDGYTLVSSMTD